jgi:hypothetical protein
VRTHSPADSRFYDTEGNLVLKDPGEIRFAFDVDYNGIPSDPTDDEEIPDSFRVVRGSTGISDFSDRDFCADLVEFTRPSKPTAATARLTRWTRCLPSGKSVTSERFATCRVVTDRGARRRHHIRRLACQLGKG